MEMTLERETIIAETIARLAHFGAVCKFGGEPFITHPEAVAASTYGMDRPVAWLHDVLEDVAITATHLRAAGISTATIAAVTILTRNEGTYEEYIDDIVASGNVSAMRVKVADLTHNLRPSCPDSLRPRYEAARKRLMVTLAALALPPTNFDEGLVAGDNYHG